MNKRWNFKNEFMYRTYTSRYGLMGAKGKLLEEHEWSARLAQGVAYRNPRFSRTLQAPHIYISVQLFFLRTSAYDFLFKSTTAFLHKNPYTWFDGYGDITRHRITHCQLSPGLGYQRKIPYRRSPLPFPWGLFFSLLSTPMLFLTQAGMIVI